MVIIKGKIVLVVDYLNLIGIRIKNIRKEKQQTLKEVSQGIISIPYLANIENGVKTASIETLIHIANRLEIPEEVLLVAEEKTNFSILQELNSIFEALVFSNTMEAEQKLNNIAENVDLRYELPAIELGFYCLQAGLYYKTWKFSKAEEIERKHLNNAAKHSAETFPTYLQSFYYYCQGVKNAHATCNYSLSRKYWKKSIELTTKPDFLVVFNSYICTYYICESKYEPALKYVARAADLIQTFEHGKQERIISVLYFYGYIYFQIGFMKEAKNKFEQAMIYFSEYPKATPIYYFLIQFKLAEIQQLEGNEVAFNEKLMTLYNEIVTHKALNIEFNNNDFLVITELMVIFAEQGFISEVNELINIMNDVEEHVMELDFFIEYAETLLFYHQNQQTSYEEKMLQLLKKINNSNDPALINRVKKHASKHFANSTKYKMAYDILS